MTEKNTIRVLSLLMMLSLFSASIFTMGQKTVAAENKDTGLIISPPIDEKTISPSQTSSGIVKISNPTQNDFNVKIEVEDFTSSGEDGGQSFIPTTENSSSYALGKWVSVKETISLKSMETQEIPYVISVPANAEAGGHYGVIFFTPTLANVESVLNSNGASLVPKIGSLILVTVPGDIKNGGKIASFETVKKLYIDSKNDVTFATRFQNLGNVHVKPEGNIIIKNTLGKQVADLVFNEKLGNTLPGGIRRYDNEWEKKLGFGLYKAELNLKFGDGQTLNSTLSFWIIPWKETSGVVLVIIILIFIITHIQWRKSTAANSLPSQPAPNMNNQNPQPPIQNSQNMVQNNANQQQQNPLVPSQQADANFFDHSQQQQQQQQNNENNNENNHL